MWLSGVTLVTWFLLEDQPEPEPVPERPVLPAAVARATLVRSRCARRSGSPSSPTSARRDDRSACGAGTRRATRTSSRSSSGTGRAQAGSLRWSPNANGIFSDVGSEGDEGGLAPGDRRGSGNSLAFSLTRPKDPRLVSAPETRPGPVKLRQRTAPRHEIACTVSPRCGSPCGISSPSPPRLSAWRQPRRRRALPRAAA